MESLISVKTLKVIESSVSWFDSAVRCSPCPCSRLNLPIICSALGLYLLQVEPYLWGRVSQGYTCCSTDSLRHRPLKCACSSMACMGHNPSRGVCACCDTVTTTARHFERYLLPPSTGHCAFSSSSSCRSSLPGAAVQRWQWCPAHPASPGSSVWLLSERSQAQQEGDKNYVLHVWFSSNNNWQTECCSSWQSSFWDAWKLGGMWAWADRASSFWRFSMVSALLVFPPNFAGNIQVCVQPAIILYFIFWVVGFWEVLKQFIWSSGLYFMHSVFWLSQK